MKKFRLVFISSLLIFCSALFLTACGGDEKKTPSISPEIDDDILYYTTQTLSDVVIELGDEDTKGTISWEDSTLKIQKGEHEYNYTFVPESKNYKEVSGTLKIDGYELIDVTNINVADLFVDYKAGGVSSTIKNSLKNNYFAGKNVNIALNVNGEFVVPGTYSNVMFTVSTVDDYIVFKNGDDVSDSVTLSFNLTIKRNLPQVASIRDISYTGEFIEPIVVFSDGSNLIKDSDYTVKYFYKSIYNDTYTEVSRPLNPGDYLITITGTGDYKGETSVAFKIVVTSFPEVTILSSTFDGTAKTPNIEIPNMVEDVDYEISWEFKPFGADEFVALDTTVNNFVNAGSYRATITGIGVFDGFVKTTDYEVDMAELPNVSNISSANYNGLSQTPNIEIGDLTANDYIVNWQYKSTTASEFSDYTLDADASKNFVNAGEYKAIITGINNYTGSKTVTFVINKVNRTGITISKNDDLYNSAVNMPSLNGYTGEGVTYYYNNTNSTEGATELTNATSLDAGIYYVFAVINADNNYNIFTTPAVQFEVSKITLQTVVLGNKTFNGNSQVPAINIDGLVENIDYSLGSWQYRASATDDWAELDTDMNNFVNAGFYEISINGIGNYSGSYEITFEIQAKSLEVDLNSITDVNYNGNSQKPIITITGLTENTDYTISYSYRASSNDEFESLDANNNFVNAGEYKIIIRGIDNYSGEYTKTFKINKINRTDITISKANDTYNSANNMPSLNGYTGDDEDVTYYYNTTNSTVGASLFTAETVLDIGTYYIYAVITADNNYNEFTTALVEFTVNKASSVDVANATEFVRALKNANVVNLTADIGTGTEGEEISINAFDGYDINTTINMNGKNINSRLSIRNFDANARVQYNNSITLTINGTENSKETIGSLNSEDNIFAGIVVIGNDDVTVELNNLIVAGKTYGFSSNGLCDGASLTATNCEFSAYDLEDSCGAYLPAGYTYNFENCLFNGANGVYIKDGTLTLTDCELTGVGSDEFISIYGDYYSTGDALTIDSNSKYASADSIVVNIISTGVDGAGCHFNSTYAYGIREGISLGETCYASINIQGESYFATKAEEFNHSIENVFVDFGGVGM